MAIDPKRLLELRRIAQHGSLSQAAASLGVSQPALSKSISILERSVGARVVERSRRGSALTNVGELLLGHAEGLEALLQRAADDVDERKKGRSGSIVIGVSPVATASLVPRAISCLLAETPHVSTAIYEKSDEELMRQLRSGDIDVIVSPAGAYRDPPDVRAETIIRDQFAIFVQPDHKLAKKKRVSLHELRDAHWVVPDIHTAMHRQIEALFAAQGEPWPHTVVTTNSITTLKSLIMWNDFVSISSTVLMQPDVRAGYITPISLREASHHREITVRTRSHVTSPLVNRFIEHLRHAASI